MRGSAMTLTFTALLCLGLCWGPWDQGQPEVLPKPSIWVDPGTMVAQGSPVTIWCQGSLLAEVYRLHKERSSVHWEAKAPQGSRNKAWFHFASSSSSDAGQYWCAYHSRNGWSQRSDPLPLVVTGVYRAPSLSAQPSPVVAAGGSVSLTCSSQYAVGTLHLLKEGGADPLRHKTSRNYGNQGREQAVFPVGPVTTSHGGTYRCYDAPSIQPYLWSRPSDPLHLQVTGLSRAPSLSAQPSSLVLAGDNLTLQCRSEAGFGSFALTKDEGLSPPLRLEGQRSPDFPLGRVSRAHGGRYRCYSGHNSYAWSAPSGPLDILIAGMHRKPSLSARPGASVPQGENVTLQCRSEVRSDTFHLSKEGSLAAPQHLRLQDPAPPVQANFTLRAVTSAHSGTYRCYSSHSTAPHLLSIPSDPLELQVSGSSRNELLPALESGSGLTWYLSVLIGVSVTFFLLLLVFLFLRHRGQDRHRKSAAAASVLEDRGQKTNSSPAADAPESLYCAVTEDAQPEHGRARDSQAATSEAPQDVTYAELDHSTSRQGVTAPSNWQSGESPAEPSVYAALALH
ncbi:leukocyte immunoglobulin-like receptor subfamily B member 3 isoform X1 [Bos javanicus]|uniref:leukocyte immunoglobulin-like receptor subfamily B member 3 isoform X1 n=1 Tax=Bos javanicus TaxID=9906 RepID=UPI002AA5FE02|nr:leukocyte immunoglobulin-like receptor subfamily B member 3 isoform X1 [Bos javanicus]XP_061245413.1 leukocyte immunoglobulin-like receptor subfamily B member 3 isoform X1 [Bos javanicus]